MKSAMLNAEYIAKALSCGKASCNCNHPDSQEKWKVHCPAHNDSDPSLSVTDGDDGIILVKCFAGCTQKAVIEALKGKGLWPENNSGTGERVIEAVYRYLDANGKPFETVRYKPKDFAQRQPDGNGGYVWNLKGIVPTLYHQDELKQAIDSGKTIYIPEGEKDVDNLRKLGLVATCNPMGAGKWRDSYSEALKGADLVLIPDKDKPGRDHVDQEARLCNGKAKRIRVLKPLGESKDVSDWLDSDGNIERLKQLADACPDYKPQTDEAVKLRCMADVKAEKVNWLWPPYIPKRKITGIDGDPGEGKSWLSLAIATAVSLGKGLPGQELTEPANVVIASAEDGLGDTIRPRLDAMGADVNRIFAIDGALTLDENGFALLESYVERVRPALVIIDPLFAYLAGVDINRANETRAVMSQLARLAEKFDVAILAIRHLTKSGMSKPIYRGLGSIDFTAACRSVLLAGCDSENPQNRALVHIKSNLAPMGKTIGYELREDVFYWTGESSLTAAQILAADNGAGTSELDEAMTFLKGELTGGEVPAKDIYRVAQDMGLAKRTLDRAKTKLKVKSNKKGDTWFWRLPEGRLPTLPIQKVGNLEVIEAKKEVLTEGLGNLDYNHAPACSPEKEVARWKL